MTALELITNEGIVLDTDTWLANFVAMQAGKPASDNNNDGSLDRLRAATLTQVISALEHANYPAGELVATKLYQHWIASQPAGSPHLYLAWFNLAVTLAQANDHPNAIGAYQTALSLRPDFYSAAVNLGLLLEETGHADAALQAWERALQTNDARIMLLNNRVRLLEKLDHLGEAEAELRRSLQTDPEQPDAIQHFVHIRQKMCKWPVLTDEISGLSVDSLMRYAGPMATMAITDNIAIQREAGRNWVARKTSPVPRRLSPAEGYHHDRIRIGYMSSDFCSHAMSYLITELFERHDRCRFEVFGYCSSPEDGSVIRARVIRSFDHHKRIKDMPDEEAARLIREDEIDILIDLNGLTSGVRPQILRWKPAPVQATYLGFVGPVPLPELDYMLCDEFVVPPSQTSAYDPTPLYIGENYQANDSKRAVGRAMSRAEVGLSAESFVFCCFSRHYKITEEIFGAWVEILRAADKSVLWLAHDNAMSEINLRDAAVRAGLASERIIFADRIDPLLYMSRLRLPDLFLDTFPYNAGTVASDALRMELPLLTLCGEAFASRMAGSLLTALGVPEGIATSRAEYVAKAIKLATDADAYRVFRGRFTKAAWAKSIGDIVHFTTDFEATLSSLIKKASPCSSRISATSAPIEAPTCSNAPLTATVERATASEGPDPKPAEHLVNPAFEFINTSRLTSLWPAARHPYYIVTPVYARNSAGIRCLHLLAHWLNRLGYSAWLVVSCARDIPVRTDPALSTPELTPAIARYHHANGLTPIVVYPEVATGNPLQAAVVARYVLNFPGLLGGDASYPSEELVFGFSSVLAEAAGAPDNVLHIPSVDTALFSPEPAVPRRGTCHYIHKYGAKGGMAFRLPPGSIEIPYDSAAMDHSEIAALFRRSELFYTYENTSLMQEACLCGCPAVMMPNEWLTAPITSRELGMDGIAWGDSPEEVARARATVGRVRENYAQTIAALFPQLERFVNLTQARAARTLPNSSPLFYQDLRIETMRPPRQTVALDPEIVARIRALLMDIDQWAA